jgi:4a-hydroxytetrahydrobiopterin dehydratase
LAHNFVLRQGRHFAISLSGQRRRAIPKLSPDRIASLTRDLPEWTSDGEALSRKLKFKDFKKAFAFMTDVAAKADEMDHHPEWSNVYSHVSIRLTTHDAGGLTEKDLALARHIDSAAAKQNAEK